MSAEKGDMNLFETIPGNFFSVLSSRNKELYVDALMLLYRLFKYELNIVTSDYLSALIGLLENRSYELEDDDEETEGGLSLNTKARLILNRLAETGWVDRENMDGSFVEVITPRAYAIQVMQLLHDLSNEQVGEYNSLVFSTYSALREARENQQNQMYEAVLNARANTEKLLQELKTLYHGIRGHLKRIQGLSDINTLLRDHFDEYKALADRIYHPIKTMDSVHRYIAPIREVLQDTLGDADLMDSMRKRAMSIRRYNSEEEAGFEIINAIDYVLDAYQSLGRLVNEIDKKHSSYTKLSVDTIRYHMSADQTISGNLVTLLKKVATSSGEEREETLTCMEQRIRINRQEFLDGRSLWRKSAKNRMFSEEPLTVNRDGRLTDDEARHLMNYIRNDYSLQHIKKYLDELFGEKGTVSTAEMEIEDDREFILLLLALIRAGERNAGFKARLEDGNLQVGGYTVPHIVFSRAGTGR